MLFVSKPCAGRTGRTVLVWPAGPHRAGFFKQPKRPGMLPPSPAVRGNAADHLRVNGIDGRFPNGFMVHLKRVVPTVLPEPRGEQIPGIMT